MRRTADQPFRDAGLLLLLVLLLGSVRIEGGGLELPAFQKLAGAQAVPATLFPAPEARERPSSFMVKGIDQSEGGSDACRPSCDRRRQPGEALR